MKRSHLLLAVLAGVLLLVLFWLLLLQPQREELAEVRTQIAEQEVQQLQLETELARLRTVREEAPAVAAELVAAQAVVPSDAALPAALRQLQLAADEAGLVLQSVNTSRPEPVDLAPPGAASMNVNVLLRGSYFQLVDFLRRSEDPSITPRGVMWRSLSIAKDEYPLLTVTLSGELFALLPTPPEPAPAVEGADDDADVEIEVDTSEEGTG